MLGYHSLVEQQTTIRQNDNSFSATPRICSLYRDTVVKGFTISGFFSIHFTVTLAGLNDIVRYVGDVVIKGFVISGLCSMHFTVTLGAMPMTLLYIRVLFYTFYCNFGRVANADIVRYIRALFYTFYCSFGWVANDIVSYNEDFEQKKCVVPRIS